MSEPAQSADLTEEDAWRVVLALQRSLSAAPEADRSPLPLIVPRAPGGTHGRRESWGITIHPDGDWSITGNADAAVAWLFDLYVPICLAGAAGGFVIAHLGQSLDGRIATASGASKWITGPQDLAHTHRMRALADAVVVGAGTVLHDDPKLTVRLCDGEDPVRVIVDTDRRLRPEFGVFHDGAAPTLLVCAEDRLDDATGRLGQAEVIGLPRQRKGARDRIAPRDLLDALAARGLRNVFVEGGGVTVSRFLQSGCLQQLQLTVSPLIIGSGRTGISLPEISTVAGGLRPRVRRYLLGDDVMFECRLDD